MYIRYNPVLEAVVTYTEDLAYKQAKEADDLLAQGKYLGISQSQDNQPAILKCYLTYWLYLCSIFSLRFIRNVFLYIYVSSHYN